MTRRLAAALAGLTVVAVAALGLGADPEPAGVGAADDLPPGIRAALGERAGSATAEPAAPADEGSPVTSPTADGAQDEDLETLADLLKERSVRLDAREVELDSEEQRLESLRREVEARFEELKALRKALDERIDEFRDELASRRNEQVVKLVKAMATMPPEAAGAVAVEMDEGVVVRVLDRMKGRSVARILAAMPSDKAARVGQRLALYRSGTKKEAAAKGGKGAKQKAKKEAKGGKP